MRRKKSKNKKYSNKHQIIQVMLCNTSQGSTCKARACCVLGSKDLGFYVFRTLMCIVGKP